MFCFSRSIRATEISGLHEDCSLQNKNTVLESENVCKSMFFSL